jgi:hypothetical protein
MLVIDDILLAPLHGLGFIVRQIHQAARQERENESDRLRAELGDLYMMLETGKITEAEFSAREAVLLDRLARVEAEDRDADDEPHTNL